MDTGIVVIIAIAGLLIGIAIGYGLYYTHDKQEKARLQLKTENILIEAEEKAKAAEEARIKAEEDAQLKAEEDAKAKAAQERAKIEAELEDLRQKRAAERAKLAGKRADVAPEEVSKTPAAVQKSMVDKMIDNLAWIHRKV